MYISYVEEKNELIGFVTMYKNACIYAQINFWNVIFVNLFTLRWRIISSLQWNNYGVNVVKGVLNMFS